MFHIAICDNDPQDLRTLSGEVQNFLDKYAPIPGQIFCYTSADALLADCEQKKFNMYILDIVMPKTNGIDLGKAIRDFNPKVPIIYTTSSREFAFEAFSVHALYYIEKPIQRDELYAALKVSMDIDSRFQYHRIAINAKNGIVTENLYNVMYVENISRSAYYTLSDGRTICSTCNRSTFEATVSPLVKHPYFIHPHKSFFVNMNYIHIISNSQLVMDDDKIIPISKKNIAATKKEYLQFLAERGDMS